MSGVHCIIFKYIDFLYYLLPTCQQQKQDVNYVYNAN